MTRSPSPSPSRATLVTLAAVTALALPVIAGGQAPAAASAVPAAAASAPNALEPADPHTRAACTHWPDYPPSAMRANATGETLMRMRVTPDGKLLDVHVVRGAGVTREHALMDDEAVAQLSRCRAQFEPSAPRQAGDRTLLMAFSWRLDSTKPASTVYDAAALARLRERAQAGDAEAAYQFFVHSPYQPAALDEPIRWLTFAADHGQPGAQYDLGRLRLYGEGLPADPAGAESLWRAASAQGHEAATRALVTQYLDPGSPLFGLGDAQALLARAAAAQQLWAALRLADLYAAGKVVEKDDHAAAALWRRAMRMDGDTTDAALHLCVAYEAGRGVDRDMVLAAAYAMVVVMQPQNLDAVPAFQRGQALGYLVTMGLDDAAKAKARDLARRWTAGDRTALPG